MANYKFFQNKKCEFFPCHKIAKEKDFNCLFCFCPLYSLGDKCGGEIEYLADGTKDCSSCTLPHIKKNYQLIVDRTSILVDKIKFNDNNYKIKKVLIATYDREKINEYNHMIEKDANKNIKFCYLKPKHTNTTSKYFNADKGKYDSLKDFSISKAKFYGNSTKEFTLAEANELVIDGISNSIRIVDGETENINFKILNKNIISDVDKETANLRKAKFLSIITIYDPKKNFLRSFFGEVRGHIVRNIKDRENTKKYESIFYIDKVSKKMSTMDMSEKNSISHRSKAFYGFLSWLYFFS